GGAGDPVGHLSGAGDDDTAGFAAVRRDLPAVDQAGANLHALFVVDWLAGGEHVAVLGEVPVDVEDDIALLAKLGTAAILPVEPQVLVELVEPEVDVDLIAEITGRESHRLPDPVDEVVSEHVADDLQRRSLVPLVRRGVGALDSVHRGVDEAEDVVENLLVASPVERELAGALLIVGVDGIE